MTKYIALAVVAVALIYLFLPSGDDAGEIEALFNEVLEAGKKKDLEGVMEHFSINYKDDYGATYPVVKNVIKTFFEKFEGFDAGYSNLTVSIGETEEGERQAAANVDVYVLGTRSGIPVSILGDKDDTQNLTVTLTESTLGGWKIIKVEGVELEERF